MASNEGNTGENMAIPDKQDDAELMRRAASGDEEAFAAIYQRTSGGLYRFALHMSGSRTVAEDVTQEVFLALLHKFADYDPTRGTLVAYLFGIARKHLLRYYERSRPHLVIGDESSSASAAVPEALIERGNPLSTMSSAETVDTVRRAVLSLPPRYREAVVLCELEEMTYEEAASVAACSTGTIRSRLHRGRALLAIKLRGASDANPAAAAARSKGCIA